MQKAFRGLEIGVDGLDRKSEALMDSGQPIEETLQETHAGRLFAVRRALREGISVERVFEYTGIDPWFLDNIAQIVELEEKIVAA